MKPVTRKWLFLPIEVKPREYHSRLLVAMKAMHEGCGVILGRQGNLKDNLPRYPTGVFFDKSIDAGKAPWYRQFISGRKGMILVGNDEEGLGSEGNEWFYLAQRHSEEVLGIATKFYTWGRKEADLVRRHFANGAAKIVTTGNPRADIWKSGFKEIYRRKAERLQKRFGPYILMPSSFAKVRCALGPDFVEEDCRKRGVFNTAEGTRDFAAMMAFMQNSLRKFEELAVRVAREFPDHTIVIRPHPSEDCAAWRRFAEGKSNIRIVLEGEISPWILGSRAVVHSFCTTGLEAFLMRRPVIAYRSVEGHNYANFIANRVGTVAAEPQQVIDSLHQIVAGRYDLEQVWQVGCREISANIASLGDEEFAYAKIVDDLLRIEDWKEAPLEIRRPRLSATAIKEQTRQTLKRMLGRGGFRWQDSSYYRQKFPGLTLQELKRDLQAFSRQARLPAPRNIVRLDPYVYAMY